MRVVDVGVDSEQPLEDDLNDAHERFGEGNACTRLQDSHSPILHGNSFSLLSWLSTQVIIKSMYSNAVTFIGFLTSLPSAHRYSYLGPADMVGQLSFEQNSVIIPYSRLTTRPQVLALTFVVKGYRVNREPLVQIFAHRQLNRQLHVSCSDRHLSYVH